MKFIGHYIRSVNAKYTGFGLMFKDICIGTAMKRKEIIEGMKNLDFYNADDSTNQSAIGTSNLVFRI